MLQVLRMAQPLLCLSEVVPVSTHATEAPSTRHACRHAGADSRPSPSRWYISLGVFRESLDITTYMAGTG